MKKTIQKLMTGLLLVPVMALSSAFFMPTATFAACDGTGGMEQGVDCIGDGKKTELFGANGMFTNVINTILFVLGAASVVMIVYGGIRYTLSGGDSSSVTAAKNTILYAVIGLVVAMLAFAISNFVVTALAK